MANTTETKGIDAVKAYITPSLVTIIGFMLWGQMSEMKSDIKELLSKQSANAVRIQNNEADIAQLKQLIYYNDTYKGSVTKRLQQPAKKEDELEIN
jgi:hypothetical protein